MKQTIKKLIANFIEVHLQEREQLKALNDTLTQIDEENRIFSLIGNDWHMLTENLLIELVGEEAFDWILYYMWECDFGRKDYLKVIVNDKTYNLTTIEVLIAFLEEYENEESKLPTE